MEQLPNNLPESSLEKFMRWLPLIIGGAVAFWFWGQISSFVVKTLADTMWTIFDLAVIGAVAVFVISNPSFIWMTYKTICRKITSVFIKMDPLSYMDRYADILSDKLNNLNKTKVRLAGERVKLQRQIDTDKQTLHEALEMGKAAIQQHNDSQASLAGIRAKGAQSSIDLYTPNMDRMNKSLKFMDALSENWGVSITAMREEIDRKRTEFTILKQNAEALNQAEDFLKGDTEEGRIYKESVKALEDSVSQKIAYIDDFEKRAKPIMEGAAIEKTMNDNEGMDILNDYINNSQKLFLPDFSSSIPANSKTIDAQPRFNLLNK